MENYGCDAVNGFTKESSCFVDEHKRDSKREANDNHSNLTCKNVIQKKKTKRKHQKSQEHINAKRLRDEIANDVEVLKFSETNFSESF